MTKYYLRLPNVRRGRDYLNVENIYDSHDKDKKSPIGGLYHFGIKTWGYQYAFSEAELINLKDRLMMSDELFELLETERVSVNG